jgi:hypothetical protein
MSTAVVILLSGATMPYSLRFDNRVLHARLLAALRREGVPFQLMPDGTVQCSDEQWPSVNAVAHCIRDSCFRWYFSWMETAEDTAAFAEALQRAGLPFELEHHADHDVFLLPKADQRKHHRRKIELWPPEQPK